MQGPGASLTGQHACHAHACTPQTSRRQIKYETFLEDVNNILTSGEVPNLFAKDELAAVVDELRPAAKAAGAGETQDQVAVFFLERVRCALH